MTRSEALVVLLEAASDQGGYLTASQAARLGLSSRSHRSPCGLAMIATQKDFDRAQLDAQTLVEAASPGAASRRRADLRLEAAMA